MDGLPPPGELAQPLEERVDVGERRVQVEGLVERRGVEVDVRVLLDQRAELAALPGAKRVALDEPVGRLALVTGCPERVQDALAEDEPARAREVRAHALTID